MVDTVDRIENILQNTVADPEIEGGGSETNTSTRKPLPEAIQVRVSSLMQLRVYKTAFTQTVCFRESPIPNYDSVRF